MSVNSIMKLIYFYNFIQFNLLISLMRENKTNKYFENIATHKSFNPEVKVPFWVIVVDTLTGS